MLVDMSFWEVGKGNNIRAWDDAWVKPGLKLHEVTLHHNGVRDITNSVTDLVT